MNFEIPHRITKEVWDRYMVSIKHDEPNKIRYVHIYDTKEKKEYKITEKNNDGYIDIKFDVEE